MVYPLTFIERKLPMLQDINYGVLVAEVLAKLLHDHKKLQQIFSKKGLKGLYKELGKHPEDYGLMEVDNWIQPSDNDLFKALGLMPDQIDETIAKWIREELPDVDGTNYWDRIDEVNAVVQRKVREIPRGRVGDPGIFWESLCHLHGAEKMLDDAKYTDDDIPDICDYLVSRADFGKHL